MTARTYDELPMRFTAEEVRRLMDGQDAEVKRLRMVLGMVEAHISRHPDVAVRMCRVGLSPEKEPVDV